MQWPRGLQTRPVLFKSPPLPSFLPRQISTPAEDGSVPEAPSEATSGRFAQKNRARCEAGPGGALLPLTMSSPEALLPSANICAAPSYDKPAARIAHHGPSLRRGRRFSAGDSDLAPAHEPIAAACAWTVTFVGSPMCHRIYGKRFAYCPMATGLPTTTSDSRREVGTRSKIIWRRKIVHLLDHELHRHDLVGHLKSRSGIVKCHGSRRSEDGVWLEIS